MRINDIYLAPVGPTRYREVGKLCVRNLFAMKRKGIISGVRTRQQCLDTEAKHQISEIARLHPHLGRIILEICASGITWTEALEKIRELITQPTAFALPRQEPEDFPGRLVASELVSA
jgi:hypothetical protein